MTGAELHRYEAIGAALLQGKPGAHLIGQVLEAWLLSLATEHGAEKALALAIESSGVFAYHLQRRLGIAVTEAEQASFTDKRTKPAG